MRSGVLLAVHTLMLLRVGFKKEKQRSRKAIWHSFLKHQATFISLPMSVPVLSWWRAGLLGASSQTPRQPGTVPWQLVSGVRKMLSLANELSTLGPWREADRPYPASWQPEFCNAQQPSGSVSWSTSLQWRQETASRVEPRMLSLHWLWEPQQKGNAEQDSDCSVYTPTHPVLPPTPWHSHRP